MAGAESRRLNDSWTATPEQKKRIYWYVDEGSGIAPESGVGRSPHNVTLNNVYDWYKDPLNLKEKVLAKRPVTENDAFNFYEQEIMAAGFDGYYMRGAQNIVVDGQQKKQGVAVLLGEHTVRLRGPKFQRAEARATATAPETKQSKAVSILNQGMARYFKDNQWENAYAPGELHDTLSEIGEALEVGFGTRVIPVRPTSAKFDIFNGVHYGGNVYVNTQATVGFVNIAGHELFHELKKKRPDLYKWFADQSRQYLKDFDAYQAKLNALLQVGEKPYDTATAEEELLSDFTGDSLADPAFLQQLADASQTKFRQLLMAIRSWIDRAIAKLKGNKSERYVTDLQAMRDNLSKALVAFAEGKPIASTERVDISSLKLDEGGVSIARATWFWDAKYVHTNTKPINVDRTTNEVLDGYHRIEQAKRNGETTIEVEYVDRAAPEMSRATAGGAFYSPLERAFSGAKMTAMTGEGWASWLKANQSKLGLKADEIEWSGINEYLSLRGKEKISREDVASYLGENGVKVNSVTKRDNEDGLAEDDIYVERRIVGNGPDVWQVFRGTEVVEEFNDDDFAAANDLQEKLQKEVRDGTKYAGYIPPGSLPGSYREILVTLPAKADKIERPQVVDKGVDENGRAQFDVVRDGNVLLSFQNWAEATDFAYETYQYAKMAETKARPGFTSNHWDEPNVLAHVRLDEVETAEGRALRVIEVQSDFGQEYKRQRDAIKAAVDADFQGIVNRMTAAGVLEVVC